MPTPKARPPRPHTDDDEHRPGEPLPQQPTHRARDTTEFGSKPCRLPDSRQGKRAASALQSPVRLRGAVQRRRRLRLDAIAARRCDGFWLGLTSILRDEPGPGNLRLPWTGPAHRARLPTRSDTVARGSNAIDSNVASAGSSSLPPRCVRVLPIAIRCSGHHHRPFAVRSRTSTPSFPASAHSSTHSDTAPRRVAEELEQPQRGGEALSYRGRALPDLDALDPGTELDS